MTVGELKKVLDSYKDNLKVIVKDGEDYTELEECHLQKSVINQHMLDNLEYWPENKGKYKLGEEILFV